LLLHYRKLGQHHATMLQWLLSMVSLAGSD
jgi:hypothetical protein